LHAKQVSHGDGRKKGKLLERGLKGRGKWGGKSGGANNKRAKTVNGESFKAKGNKKRG